MRFIFNGRTSQGDIAKSHASGIGHIDRRGAAWSGMVLALLFGTAGPAVIQDEATPTADAVAGTTYAMSKTKSL